MGVSKTRRVALASATLVILLMAPAAAAADGTDGATRTRHSDVGIGLASVLANVIYVPAKLMYAVVGSVRGAAAWGLTGGNTEVAKGVWVASLGGDYFLAREMVSGDRKVHFSGPTEVGI